MYQINGKNYKLKEKYTLKEWGEIIKLLSELQHGDNSANALISLLSNGLLIQLLSLILDNPIDGELYENDVDTIIKIIEDFFSRKESLIKNIEDAL
jgi:hypothetical protein